MMIGRLLDGRYKVLQNLSSGGFGHTYIAEDTRIPGNPKCVVKHLHPDSNDPGLLATARRLFQSEAETLAQLGNHDQIPRILAYFEENQEFFLVEDFIDGQTLADELIPGKQLSESYVIALLNDVLPILEFIHQHGVIHRDIKPANIIRRDSDGKLVLIDFGAVKQVIAARSVVTQTQQASATVAIGTPGYMPTEQGRGKPRPNSDIYALGMIAIQTLTGIYPSNLGEDPDTGEIIWQNRASVSPGLAAILTQMVHYHFKDRYQSAKEVLGGLEQLNNPSYSPTVQKTVTATNLLHELTLEWLEAGQLRTYTIYENQPSKNPGTIRIGRDPQICDIVVTDPTVSGLQVEVFFNPQQQLFYVRNLRQSNPAIVNGQSLSVGEVTISQGSNLRLGQLDLRVTSVAVQQYPSGYTPPTPLPKPIPSRPIDPTLHPSSPSPPPLPLPPVPPPPLAPRPNKLPLLIGLSFSVFLSGILGVAAYKLYVKNPSAPGKKTDEFAKLLSEKPDLCRIVSPTQGNNDNARVRNQPVREAETIKILNKGEKILYLSEKDAFVEIKLPDGTQGWIFNNQIQPCNSVVTNNIDNQNTPPPITPQPSLSVDSASRCLATIKPNSNVRREPDASNPDNVIEELSGKQSESQLIVTGKQTKAGLEKSTWLQVEDSSGRRGWISRRVIKNNEEVDSCFQNQGKKIEQSEVSDYITLVTIKVFKPDSQCADYVAETIKVHPIRPATEAVNELVKSIKISNFKIAEFQVNINQGEATVNLRLASDSPRSVESLSSCELNHNLVGSIEKTLTGNGWNINKVQVLVNGNKISSSSENSTSAAENFPINSTQAIVSCVCQKSPQCDYTGDWGVPGHVWDSTNLEQQGWSRERLLSEFKPTREQGGYVCSVKPE